ncbi:uncharacterized protein TRAVEDRAFT_104242, partial [Trametes versicolor FP-101664 SS1]|uniref:uncharacterized protein n=1 Tax=Trametes versicolor (strain FP-101664) TaxID=717944 RepID=UPI000462214E
DDLDDPVQCEFQHGEQVWIKVKEPCEEWVRGEVSGIGRRTTSTRVVTGMLYSVRYKETKRAMFSPQNGVLKPDTQQVRDLLAAGGWL